MAAWRPAPGSIALALLAFSLILPSSAVVQVHFRTRGAVAYILLAAGAVVLGRRALAGGMFGWVTARQAYALGAVTAAGLLWLLLWVHPMVKLTGAASAGERRPPAGA